MSLNASFDGFSYDSTNTLGNSDIYYQGLFFPNSTASSPTTWSDVRVVEGSGYYSLNLGDNLWLSQEGSALNGSIVVLVFWRGSSDRLSDCILLSEWGATEITIDGSSVYTNNIQIKENIAPILNWSNNVPAHAYVNTVYEFYNNSYDTHYWGFNDVIMYHWFKHYGEDIFSVNTITTTDYTWGDSNSTLNLSGAASSAHSWDTAGTYTITATITDACGAEVSDTVDIEVFWAAPVLNIARCSSDGVVLLNNITVPDTPIYFKYTGTNPDDTIVSINWNIADTGSYGSTTTAYLTTDITEVIAHTEGLGTSWNNHTATLGAFTNPGTHVVTITVVWNDGFQDQTITYSESFTQERFDIPPVPNITCNEAVSNHIITPSTVVTFNYSGSDVESRITTMDWSIYDSGIYGNTNSTVLSALKTDTIEHAHGLGASWCDNLTTTGAFTNPGNHAVSIAVTWNDGWDDNIINYSETFIQDKFSGPSIDFIQTPAQAATNQSTEFENTSTSVSRVGLGLPDCEEYTWNWTDGENSGTVEDVGYGYYLSKIFTTTECSVELCADWSDGWETHTSCVSKDVVFGTIVTVTPEDCYYVINVVGTSTDGTVNGYSWTVSSGTSASGTFYEVWTSPTSENQQNKTICFSSTGWYKIEGTVYGNGDPTSDYETLYINETCPDSGSTYVLWNGTGELDSGGDWVREGFGYESVDARYKGTYGLLVSAPVHNDVLHFYRKAYTEIDISNYDFLSFWINVRTWNIKKEINIRLHSTLAAQSNYLNLSNYINLDRLEEWQRAMIPLSRFSITRAIDQVGWPTYVNELEFVLEEGMSFWIDDISFVMGLLVTVPVCDPDPSAKPVEEKQAELVPSPIAVTPHPPDFTAGVPQDVAAPIVTLTPVIAPYPRPKDV